MMKVKTVIKKLHLKAGENLVVTQDVKYSLSTIRSESTFATTLLTDAVVRVLLQKLQKVYILLEGFL